MTGRGARDKGRMMFKYEAEYIRETIQDVGKGWGYAIQVAGLPPGGWGETQQAVRRYEGEAWVYAGGGSPIVPLDRAVEAAIVLGAQVHPDRRKD